MLEQSQIAKLSDTAWEARHNARVLGPTRVGCAVLATDGRVFGGCNVEHRFRSHDVHAEVNAIATMVANGATQAVAVLIAAERDRFTPCGACMDWIMELGGGECIVAFQKEPRGEITWYIAAALMPFYPQ